MQRHKHRWRAFYDTVANQRTWDREVPVPSISGTQGCVCVMCLCLHQRKQPTQNQQGQHARYH
jgi:hypothetical protein